MRRRDLIGAASLATLRPIGARAQQSKGTAKLGILGPDLNVPAIFAEHRAFVAELQRLGFREGQNLLIEYRRVDHPGGASQMAAELAQANIDVLVADGPEVAVQAGLAATRGAVPIVIVAVNYNAVERGYATSLARPGGNVTGVYLRLPELVGKQVELLTQAFPEMARLGVLWDEISADQFSAAKEAADRIRLVLRDLKLENPPYDFDAAFQTLAASTPHSVLVLSSPLFIRARPGTGAAAAALRHRLPTMFTFMAYVQDGGLMSYGPSRTPLLIQAANYVAKILNGSKPADLPVEQATRYALAINMKTARTLGLTIPPTLLARADEVIE